MQKRFGITVVYVTHNQSEAMAMSDQVIVLKDGCVQQVDSPMRLYRAPVNPLPCLYRRVMSRFFYVDAG